MARKTDTEQLERDRETARHMAERLTQEPTTVVHLLVRKVIYHVPYRNRDGSPGGRGRTKRALILTGQILRSIIWAPGVLVLSLLADLGITFELRSKGKHFVYGNEAGIALHFADALRQADASAWLAWSDSQVVLLTNNDTGTRVLWHGAGNESPAVEMSRKTLRWSDDSRISFDISFQEAAAANSKAN